MDIHQNWCDHQYFLSHHLYMIMDLVSDHLVHQPRAERLGFRVYGSGLRVQGFGFVSGTCALRVSGTGFWVSGFGYEISSVEIRVGQTWCSTFHVLGTSPPLSILPSSAIRVTSRRFRVSVFGYKISGIGVRVSSRPAHPRS